MPDAKGKVETAVIGGTYPLTIPRLVTGLWQLAEGHSADKVDVKAAAEGMGAYVDAGLGAFDMADHYGPAEEVVGAYRASHSTPITALTKWCPAPGVVGEAACAEAVETAMARLKTDKIELLQYHVWRYDDASYLHNLYHLSKLQDAGKIAHIGLTNVDYGHLRMLHGSGYRIATNQVSMSVIDRRAETGGMAEWCAANGVGLLAYGTLLGGFISDKWVGKAEPKAEQLANWSLKKYKRFIDAAGGWNVFQIVLKALQTVASKHSVPIAAVATRYVLQQPGVTAVIIGSRLDASASEYIEANKAAFTFELDETDLGTIKQAQDDAGLGCIPGDCGDEYRHPPFLTASGNLSHHDFAAADDKAAARLKEVERICAAGGRVERLSGAPWEPLAGYCSGVRVGNQFVIAGTTTGPHPSGEGVIGGSSAEDQTTHVMDLIAAAARELGASMADITRTRVLLNNLDEWQGVSRVHGITFGNLGILPVNTMVGGTPLIPPGAVVEIEVEGVVNASKGPRLRLSPDN